MVTNAFDEKKQVVERENKNNTKMKKVYLVFHVPIQKISMRFKRGRRAFHGRGVGDPTAPYQLYRYVPTSSATMLLLVGLPVHVLLY